MTLFLGALVLALYLALSEPAQVRDDATSILRFYEVQDRGQAR